MEHTIQCIVSFMSGKKKVIHNGLTIVDTIEYIYNLCSSEEVLNATIMIGMNRAKIRIDKDTEQIKF